MLSSPPWNISVITMQGEDYKNLKNALLYGDSVEWLNFELLPTLFQAVRLSPRWVWETSSGSERFEVEISFVGGETDWSVWFRNRATHLEWSYNAETPAGHEELIHTSCVTPGDSSPLRRHVGPNECGNILQKMFRDVARKRGGIELSKHIQTITGPIAKNTTSIIWPVGVNRKTESWKAHNAAQSLQSAVSKLLLPDISVLSVEEIFELKDMLSTSLDPMRAELLRFTEDLRKMVSANADADEIEREAVNLVATRVEPVVREADHRTRELAKKKWRKFYEALAKAFGFAGASLIDSKMIAKAVQQTLEAGAVVLAKPEDQTPQPKMTAQFVLEARSLLIEGEK